MGSAVGLEPLKNVLLTPLRPLRSPRAQRAYITTLLFSLGAAFLLGVATLSYILFYINFIPRIGVEREVFLEYGWIPAEGGGVPYSLGSGVVYGGGGRKPTGSQADFPTGIAQLVPGDLIPNQPYDVEVTLILPTSPLNRDLGNFMVDLDLLSSPQPPAQTTSKSESGIPPAPTRTTLHRARRPAILTYRSPFTNLINTALRAPLLIFSLSREEEKLTIPLLQRVSFPSRAQTPESLKLTILAERVQTYSAIVRFSARLGGLRGIMYNYRLTAASIFITTFWFIEAVCAVLVWWVLVAAMAPLPAPGEALALGGKKKEEEGKAGEVQGMKKERKTRMTPEGEVVYDVDEAEQEGQAEVTGTTGEEEAEDETDEAEVEIGRGRKTPRGRGYLPSPSPTPQPSGPAEGYADDEETESTAEDNHGGTGELGGGGVEAKRGVQIEDETEDESEEEAVMVTGGGGGGTGRGREGFDGSRSGVSASATGSMRRGSGSGAVLQRRR
ncbi:putative adipose-regulatory protein-domain-containing protein [Kalaharituber pfeilii]|nr:putative adipose-regulatory protein-domain-containing protein [Kalaharituber pfeilii]